MSDATQFLALFIFLSKFGTGLSCWFDGLAGGWNDAQAATFQKFDLLCRLDVLTGYWNDAQAATFQKSNKMCRLDVLTGYWNDV